MTEQPVKISLTDRNVGSCMNLGLLQIIKQVRVLAAIFKRTITADPLIILSVLK